MNKLPGILILTPFFTPNIGGVETHLNDLVSELNRHNYTSYVLTYSPLTTSVPYLKSELAGSCQILRFDWFGKNLFHRLEKLPLFDFLYLTPYLLIRSFFWMLKNHQKIEVIHSHGINAAFIGVCLSKIFSKKHVTSTHAIYENISGLSQTLSKKVFNQTDTILCLSKKSLEQLASWGVSPQKLHLYHYWIDLKVFTPSPTLPKKFTVLFVGRLIAKKGLNVLLKAADKLPNINFIIAGNGPEENLINQYLVNHSNLSYIGPINNSKISTIYQQASILCIPSLYPEGFGRVVLEGLASGLPIIGSNRGSISEAVDSTVAIINPPTTNQIIKSITKLSTNPKLFLNLKSHTRKYAQDNYSERNFNEISKFYTPLNKD